MAGLRLEVTEFTDLARWRWGPHGSWHAAPDTRAADEARMLGELGEWIGAEVFGRIAPALRARRPATVTVVVPGDAAALAFRPLELAHADGTPLAAQGITLVLAPGAAPCGPAAGYQRDRPGRADGRQAMPPQSRQSALPRSARATHRDGGRPVGR